MGAMVAYHRTFFTGAGATPANFEQQRTEKASGCDVATVEKSDHMDQGSFNIVGVGGLENLERRLILPTPQAASSPAQVEVDRDDPKPTVRVVSRLIAAARAHPQSASGIEIDLAAAGRHAPAPGADVPEIVIVQGTGPMPVQAPVRCAVDAGRAVDVDVQA